MSGDFLGGFDFSGVEMVNLLRFREYWFLGVCFRVAQFEDVTAAS